MSENEEQVPLTRRERRLREQGETGALDLSEMAAAAAQADAAPTVDPVSSSLADDIEISPLNPDGTPRSRREIRLLREQALAARVAAQEAETEQTTEPQGEESQPEEAQPEESQPAEVENVEVANEDVADGTDSAETAVSADAEDTVDDAEANESAHSATPEFDEPVEDFDSLISPPTEPLTVEELREAESVAGDYTPDADAELPEAEPVEDVAPAAASKPRLKFWKRDKSAGAGASDADATATPATAKAEVGEDSGVAESETDAPEAEPEAPEAEVVEAIEVEAEAEVVSTEEVVSEAPAAETLAAESPITETEVAEPEVAEPQAAEAPAAEIVEPELPAEAVTSEPQAKETYSFPDIAPPEEWRSVFDDPATRNMPAPAEEPQGDFDDLISRAVAQEGSTNGTSALILPAMPEDTGGLTGPLGATGELYVTGSLRLPKSLGETGGHVSLHDSTEIDPITGAETVDEHGTVAGPAPVSARHAVSARVVSGVPAVAKPAKERTKLPLVLGLTGGGLLVVVVGLGIWGATNGMFG